MAPYSLEQLIQEAGKLPPIPQTAMKALTMIRNPDTNASSLAKVIGMDQVLAAKVLRWANSAYFGLENRILTVQQAIMVLGMKNIQELIMNSSVSDHLNRPVPGYELARGELWQHALGTAITAKLISKKRKLNIDEEAYFAGLLCDIGKLVFEKVLRDANNISPEMASLPFQDMERLCFGFDHATLGAEMARRWQLPDSLVSAIAYHHEPQMTSSYHILVSTVHVANALVMIMGIGIGIDGLRYPLHEESLTRLGLGEEDLSEFVAQATEQLSHAKELVRIG